METESAQLAIVPNDVSAVAMEMAIGMGDFSKLTATDRLNYIGKLCQFVGLNPLTKPIDIIAIQGRLVLYANKSCAEQLRGLHKITVKILERVYDNGVYCVRVSATKPDGQTDESLGAVPCPTNAPGDVRANAMMKAETKAKRRATLSLVGLGFIPDETELDTMRPAKVSEALTGGESATDRGAQLLQLSESSASVAPLPEVAPATPPAKADASPVTHASGSSPEQSPAAGVPRVESQPVADPPLKAPATTAPASLPTGAAPSVLPDSVVQQVEAVFAAVPKDNKHTAMDCVEFLISRKYLVKGADLNTLKPDLAARFIANPRGLHRSVEVWATSK